MTPELRVWLDDRMRLFGADLSARSRFVLAESPPCECGGRYAAVWLAFPGPTVVLCGRCASAVALPTREHRRLPCPVCIYCGVGPELSATIRLRVTSYDTRLILRHRDCGVDYRGMFHRLGWATSPRGHA